MTPPRSHRLTPIGDELRFDDPRPPAPRRRGPLRRLLDRRRSRTPPKTLAAAVARGLLGLAVGVGVLAAAAVGVARLVDRPAATGLFVAGAGCVLVAFLGAQSGSAAPETLPDLRHASSARVGWAVAGLALIGLGVLLESR